MYIVTVQLQITFIIITINNILLTTNTHAQCIDQYSNTHAQCIDQYSIGISTNTHAQCIDQYSIGIIRHMVVCLYSDFV